MTPEDIIKGMTSHYDWQYIKLTDPDQYKQLSGEEISKRFEMCLPFYKKWFYKNELFHRYIDSLPAFECCLKTINLSLYDRSLRDKQLLTQEFYSKCLSYGVDQLMECSLNYDIDSQFKIKNLINRSFKLYYKSRTAILRKIIKILEVSEEEANDIALFAYLPFQNHIIGLDWISRRINPTLTELLDDWIILLCFDAQLFSSEKFISDLSIVLNEEVANRLVNKLLIYLAREEKTDYVFRFIKGKYKKDINQYQKYINEGEIVEYAKFGDLRFDYKEICFYKYKMKINPFLNDSQIQFIKDNIDRERNLTLVITKYHYTNPQFRPLLTIDMQYLMSLIERSRNEFIPVLQFKYEDNDDINNSVQKDEELSVHNMNIKVKDSYNAQEIRIIDRTLAKNISANMFKISKSVIEYSHTDGNKYFLRSVRIDEDVSYSVLERIDHKFTLVKDKSVINGKNTEFRFHFNPANDFSFLLAEIKRICIDETINEDCTFPQTGEFDIPWKFVRFYEGIITIFHPNPSKRGTISPFHYRHSDILATFEDIRPYIEKRCCKLRVKSADGVIISLLNIKEFLGYISQFKDWEEVENIETGYSRNTIRKAFVSKDVFLLNKIVNKSPYLLHLATLQHPNYKIAYLLERVIHESGFVDNDEYGYLFVLKESKQGLMLLYENITDSSRSSIIFNAESGTYDESLYVIKKFLASTIKNKRQKLSYGQIKFTVPFIHKVRRIMHTNLFDWKYNLSRYLRL